MRRVAFLFGWFAPAVVCLWSCAHVPLRPPKPPSAPPPSVLVQQLSPTLALQPLRWDTLPVAVPPELNDDLQLVRVTFKQQRSADASLEPVYQLIAERGQHSYPLDLELLAHYTREKVPTEIRNERFRSAGFPFLFNVLTLGIVEVLTLHREVSTRTPDREDLLRAAPRAMAIFEQLVALADERRGQQALLLPRRELPWRLTVTLRSVVPYKGYGPRAPEPVDPAPVRVEILAASDAIDRGEAPFDGSERSLLSFAKLDPLPPSAEADTVMLAPWLHPRPAAPTPEHLATLTENEKARPAWAEKESPINKDDLSKLAELSGFVPLPGGAVNDATLRCLLGQDLNPDWARVKLPRRKLYRDGLYGHYIIVPFFSLQSGDTIELTLGGRTARQFLFFGANEYTTAVLRGRYTGQLPLTLRDGRRQLQCDVLPRLATETIVEQSLDSLWQFLDGIQLAPKLPQPWPLRPDALDWGFSSGAVTGARNAVAARAAWLGWADPRLAAHLQRLTYLTELYKRHIRLYLAEQAQHTKEVTFRHFLHNEEATIAVRLVAQHCGAAAGSVVPSAWAKVPADRCVFELELSHREGQTAQLSSYGVSLCELSSFHLLWEDGSAVPLTPIGRDQQPRKDAACAMAPGDSTRIYLLPQEVRPQKSSIGEPTRESTAPPVLLQFYAFSANHALYLRL